MLGESVVSSTSECCHLPQRQGRVAASVSDVISICVRGVCFATAHADIHVSVSARDHPPAFYSSPGQAKQIIRN